MLEDFLNQASTPAGIGVDCVRVSELKALDERLRGGFVKSTFTEQEKALAENAQDYWAFLAGRFAVKEAVFKAASPQKPEVAFDLRRVETLRRPDGSPYVAAQSLPQGLGIREILVSITGQDDYAVAFVQVLG